MTFSFTSLIKILKILKPSKFKTFSPEVSYIQQRKAELHIISPSVNKSDIQRKSIQSLLYYIILIKNGKTSRFLYYTSFSLKKKEQNLKISVWFKFQIFIIFVLLRFRKCKPRM